MNYIFPPHKFQEKKNNKPKSLLPLLEFSSGNNLAHYWRRLCFISGAKGDKIRILFFVWLSVSLAGWYPVIPPLQLDFSGLFGLFHHLIKRLLSFKEATSSPIHLLYTFSISLSGSFSGDKVWMVNIILITSLNF